MKVNIAKKLHKKMFFVVKIIREAADSRKLSAYLVGGPVRDILLNKKIYDLDFVVEGNGVEFAKRVNDEFKGELKTYQMFGTASIFWDNFRIDIVTARKEIYKKPAAYPDVKPGAIGQDLYRRDFTINAMALCVNEKRFGELVDFYNGYKDLKNGIIRVMHDKSFIDDPTRIFRVVKFSVRFGFKVEAHTKDLIKEAIFAGYLGDVNRGRIRKEVELFLKEKKPLKCLDVFSKLMS